MDIRVWAHVRTSFCRSHRFRLSPPYSLFTMDSFLRKKSAAMSSMSAANSEGQPGQEKQEEEEAKASDKEETKESDNKHKEAAKGSVEEESKVSSDDDEEMHIGSKEKAKATTNETLQDFQLDRSNMGQNSPTGGKRSRSLTSDVWKSISRLVGPLAKSALCAKKTHICTHCSTLLKLYKSQAGSWQTSVGLQHLANCPAYAKSGIESEAVETSKASNTNKKLKRQSVPSYTNKREKQQLQILKKKRLHQKRRPLIPWGWILTRMRNVL